MWATNFPEICPAEAAAKASTRSPTTSATSLLNRDKAAAMFEMALPVEIALATGEPLPRAQGTTAFTRQPSATIALRLRPRERSRCIPVTMSWSVSDGCAAIVVSVERIKPNSARVPVTKQTRRVGAGLLSRGIEHIPMKQRSRQDRLVQSPPHRLANLRRGQPGSRPLHGQIFFAKHIARHHGSARHKTLAADFANILLDLQHMFPSLAAKGLGFAYEFDVPLKLRRIAACGMVGSLGGAVVG